MEKRGVKEVDWAWLAGVIDGEGTISLIHRKTKGHYEFEPIIAVSQKMRTGMPLLKKVAKITGRNIIRTGKRELNYRSVQVYGYESILYVLKNIYPYLTSKKERAKLMMKFCESRIKNFGYHLTPEEVEIIKRFRKTLVSHKPKNKKKQPELRMTGRPRKEILRCGMRKMARVIIPRRILRESNLNYGDVVSLTPLDGMIRVSKDLEGGKHVKISRLGHLFLAQSVLKASKMAIGDPIKFIPEKNNILIKKAK